MRLKQNCYFSNYANFLFFSFSDISSSILYFILLCFYLIYTRNEINILTFILCLEKPPLPPGVTQKDADLYREVREKAAKQLQSITKPNLANSPTKLSPTTSQLVEQERCPAAIEFGKYEIETWYSSPFPQEYAR